MDCDYKVKAQTQGYCIGMCSREQHEQCCQDRTKCEVIWYDGFFRTHAEIEASREE